MPSLKKKPVNGIYKAQGRNWTEDQYKRFRKYQTDFNKKRYKMYGIRFIKSNDNAIIKWLDSQDNLSAYFKKLVLSDMKKHNK